MRPLRDVVSQGDVFRAQRDVLIGIPGHFNRHVMITEYLENDARDHLIMLRRNPFGTYRKVSYCFQKPDGHVTDEG